MVGAFGPRIPGRRIPANISKAEAIANLRKQGQEQMAAMLEKSSVVSGQGIDFSAISHLVLLAILLYAISSLFIWVQGYLMAGVMQRTVYRLPQSAEEKIGRLPLSYFDTQSRSGIGREN